MSPKHRVILIGGTSHTGKSTVARSLASQLGWGVCPTDKLARHPGRPWQVEPKRVPAHVADHYRSLPVDELVADVLRHYTDNVWPLVESIVSLHATDLSTNQLIIEGSAVLPELAATLTLHNVAAVWLSAGNELLKRRIYASSKYKSKSPHDKQLIDKFLDRTCRFNERTEDAVKQLGLASISVERASSVDQLTDICLSVLEKRGYQIRNRSEVGNNW